MERSDKLTDHDVTVSMINRYSHWCEEHGLDSLCVSSLMLFMRSMGWLNWKQIRKDFENERESIVDSEKDS